MNKFVRKVLTNKAKYFIILYAILSIVSLVWALIVGEIEWNDWYQILIVSLIFTGLIIAIFAIVLFTYFWLGYGKFWEFSNLDDAKQHYSKIRALKIEVKKLKNANKHNNTISDLENKKANLSEKK